MQQVSRMSTCKVAVMNKQIIPSSLLEKCPRCNTTMILSLHIGGKETACAHCDYTEPAGSATAVTFISNCLAEYASQLELDTMFLRDIEFTIPECMEGNGLLPLFVERVEQIQSASGLLNTPGIGLGLKVVEDVKGILASRVVMKSPTISVATNMCFLAEILHETMDLTKNLGTRFYGNQICADYMPCVNPIMDISGSSSGKFHKALQAAAQQQPVGAPGERR